MAAAYLNLNYKDLNGGVYTQSSRIYVMDKDELKLHKNVDAQKRGITVGQTFHFNRQQNPVCTMPVQHLVRHFLNIL
jgi:hypothetical protein